MGGEIVARAIVDGDTTWRMFTPFELVWAGGAVGRTAQQVYYWSYRANELMAARLARRRKPRRRPQPQAQPGAARAG
jgi:hypothetical protein